MAYLVNGLYRVMCREDTQPDGTQGKYVPATACEFPQVDKAIAFARSIAESREPIVVQVIWNTEPIE